MAELAVELESRGVGDFVPQRSRTLQIRVWSSLWPKLVAAAIALGIWQIVVWSGWRPALPGPLPVLHTLLDDLTSANFYAGVAITMRRALAGYAIAVVIGSALGILVARVIILRKAVGSAILGLQSMPSIAWFPLAILIFQHSEPAIILVVLLGAGPAIASGLLSGIDHVEPLLVRVGRVMGARGFALYRHVVLPAALPSFVAGLKHGWAFSWRSLMAAELIVFVGQQPSLGQQLRLAQNVDQLLAVMIVIFTIGVVIDTGFGILDRGIRRRWGLLGSES
jgi:NitT/TauT family transport system permease protein